VVNVWELGLELSDLDGQEDALAKAIASAAAQAQENGKLAAAVGLKDLTDGPVFGSDILAILEPVCASGSAEAKAAAYSLLGNQNLFDRRSRSAVQELLLTATSSEMAEPGLRVEAARALWKIGSDEQKSAAKGTMRDFLMSSKRQLQVQAALTLAGDMNAADSDSCWQVIREIADQPTAEGRLARSLIGRQEQSRLWEGRFRKVYAEMDRAERGASDQYTLLTELMIRAHALHIRGEDFADEELIEEAAKGLMQSLDPNSAFFTAQEYERFFTSSSEDFAGIGAFVDFDNSGMFAIVRPLFSGPAQQEGLQPGDRILQIDGWDTSNRSSDEILSRLKGREGSTVKIQFIRQGMQEPEEISLQRSALTTPSVNYAMLPGKLGYIDLLTFAAKTGEELNDAIVDLQSQGARGLILDVRNNTRGYVPAARNVVEQFLAGEELVTYSQGRKPEDREDLMTRNAAVAPEIPLAVLVNERSASAAEITAGALQDHQRATIIGKQTLGQATIQDILALNSSPDEKYEDANNNGQYDEGENYEDSNENGKYDSGAHIKITIARYHLPSGRSLQREFDITGRPLNPYWGIRPDRVIDFDVIKSEDAWKNAEIYELSKKGVFKDYIEKNAESNSELLLQLAEADAGSSERYPDFESFYEGLETNLSKEDIRRRLRLRIRDWVGARRSKPFAGTGSAGDFQEDPQLQEGMRILLEGLGEDIRKQPEMQGVLKLDFETSAKKKAAKNG
jgi:C-terminal peptidase prc